MDVIVAGVFYSSVIPFNATRPTIDPEFEVSCFLVKQFGRYGLRYKLPTVQQLRSPLLEEHVNNIDEMKRHKTKWKLIGWLLFDGWTNKKGRCIINLLLNSTEGCFYLYSIDTSCKHKSAKFFAKTLDEAMQKIGMENVAQICTNNATNYSVSGTS